MPGIRIPRIAKGATNQDLARGLLAVSDVARQLSLLRDALRSGQSATILTGCVRQMSVSLRAILLERKARLFTRLFQDGFFPAWPTLPNRMLHKVVVEASPAMTIEYEMENGGERRRLKTPPYRHGFVVTALHGVAKPANDRFTILANPEIWTRNETKKVADWLRWPVFEVDGLAYDLEMTIKIVADKEGAHIDQVVDAERIYTASSVSRVGRPSSADAYVRSRLVKFGPFTYPHIVVFCVARYLVTVAKASLTVNSGQLRSLSQQVSFADSTPAVRERLEVVMACPSIGRIEGLPLRVSPEGLVMRPPTPMGLDSSDDEQRLAARLPQYGETCIGAASPAKGMGRQM